MGNWNSGRYRPTPTAGTGQVSDKLISQELCKQLREDPEQPDPPRRTKAAKIAANLLKYALGQGRQIRPSLKAIAETWNRAEGTPVQSIGITMSDPEQQAQRIHAMLNDLTQLKQLEKSGSDGAVH